MPKPRKFNRLITTVLARPEWVASKSADGLKRFNILGYTGVAMRVRGWDNPVVIDINGLQMRGSRPALRSHDTDRVVGHTDSMKKKTEGVRITGVMSVPSADSKEIIDASANGFPWQASVGASPVAGKVEVVEPGDTVEVNGRKFRGPLYVARKSFLDEISFVPLGADDNTSAVVAEESMFMTFKKWLAKQGFKDEKAINAGQRRSLKKLYNKEIEASKGGITTSVSNTDSGSASASTDGVRASVDSGSVSTSESITVDRPKKTTKRTVKRRSKTVKASKSKSGDASLSIEASLDTGSASVSESVDVPAPGSRRQLKAEKIRIAGITRICAGLDSLRDKAISRGWSENKTKLRKLRVTAARAPGVGIGRASSMNAKTMECALAISHLGMDHNVLAEQYGEQVMEAAQDRGMRDFGIQALLIEVIRAHGGSVPRGRFNNATIEAAFEIESRIRASGVGFSTIGLSGILSNIANKSMLSGYQARQSDILKLCGVRDANDFKTMTSYRMTADGTLQEVGPTGEIKHIKLLEDPFTNIIKQNAAMLMLSRVMMINDDLGAFTQIVQLLGRACFLLVEQTGWTKWMANAANTQLGGSNFWDTANAPVNKITTKALSLSNIEDVYASFMSFTDKANQPILLTPKYLVVPPALMILAQKIYKSTNLQVTPTTASKAEFRDNVLTGMFEPVISPYLSNSAVTNYSTSNWWLAADPADVASIQIAYLRGQRNPVIEQGKMDFDNLGMGWRSVFDFGISVQDGRGSVLCTA